MGLHLQKLSIMSKLSALGLASVYDLLTGFAHRDDFWGLFETAFGTQYDSSVAEGLRLQCLAGDFGQFPKVEVVSEPVLGTANGAYAASTNTIYLSDRFGHFGAKVISRKGYTSIDRGRVSLAPA